MTLNDDLLRWKQALEFTVGFHWISKLRRTRCLDDSSADPQFRYLIER
jgi:hypothetical protein